MTVISVFQSRNRLLRQTLTIVFAVLLAAGAYVVSPSRGGHQITGYFASAVGLYPGDEVRVIGVPVGEINSVEPRADGVKISMTVDDSVRLPADAGAIIVAPNLVSARFIQLAPAYTEGPTLPDHASIGLDRTAVPVEWDEIKEQLTQLSAQLGPEQGNLQGPLGRFVNQAADTLDGNGDSFRQAVRELSQTAGRLGDSSTDLFGTVKNLQVLVDALSSSNEQIVQFTDHVASVSQVLADSSTRLDSTLDSLNGALTDVRDFLHDGNDELVTQVGKLTDFTKLLSDQHDDLEQLLHVAPNGLVNFYNIYEPAQGTVSGLLSVPNFANPMQFLCAGTLEVEATPENYRRAEICKERMGPVIRRWIMTIMPLLFHPINSITAYKGQIIYDTPETQAKAETPLPYLQWGPAPDPAASNEADGVFLPPVPGQLGRPPGPPPPPAPSPQGAGG